VDKVKVVEIEAPQKRKVGRMPIDRMPEILGAVEKAKTSRQDLVASVPRFVLQKRNARLQMPGNIARNLDL